MNDLAKSKAQLIAELDELRSQNRQFRSLLENSKDMLYRMSLPDGTYEYISPASSDIFGYSPDEFYQSPLLIKKVIHPDWHEYFEKQWQLLLAGDMTPYYEYQILHKSGETRLISQRNFLICDKSEKPIAIEGIVTDITDLKQVEDALRESEDFLNRTNDIALVGGWELDLKNNIVNWTRTTGRIHELPDGYSPDLEEAINYYHPDDRDIVRESVSSAVEMGTPLDFEVRLITAKGRQRWVHALGQPIFEDGTCVLLSGTFQDITERKNAEDKLKESEEKYRNLIETSQNLIFQCDREGKFIYLNNTWESVLGYKIDEMLGRKHSDFKLKETAARDVKEFARIIKDGAVKGYETQYINKNGDEVILLFNAMVIHDNDGNVIGTQGTAFDITARKQAEETLRESEEKYRSLVERANDGVVIAQDGIVLFVNTRMTDLFGYTVDEMINTPFIDFVFPDDRERIIALYNRRLQGEDVHEVYELGALHKDGRRIEVENNSGIITYNGTPAVLSFLRDITERKQLEEERTKASKLESVGILAGGIAHDFNNILTAVLGNTSLARMRLDHKNQAKELLSEVEKASLRAKDLTQQLLTFSKGGAPVREVSELLPLLIETVRFSLRGSNVKYRTSIPSDLWVANVDKGQISQAIGNLVINAQQSMPEGGTIHVVAENVVVASQNNLPLQNGNHVKISVIDQGHGIPAERLTKIFDPYFTTKQKGSGLGLATTYSIVNRHDGYIGAESEVGVGTTFHIYLPATTKHVEKTSVDKEPTAATGKILVMDDDDGVRNVVKKMLTNLGHEVTEAVDGAEAIELYANAKEFDAPFDVVILDLTIPGGIGGKETIQKLLEIDPDITAVVSSGYANDPVIANFEDYGFKANISKPYQMATLKMTINMLLTTAQN